MGHNTDVEPEHVVDTEFAKTIAAAKDIERSQWALGDALVEECGPPSDPGEHTGSDEKLMLAKIALKAAGCEYSFEYLREIRRTAANFPTGERSPDGEALPFSYFLLAGTPEKLQIVREKAKADGIELTARFVRETLKEGEVDIDKLLASASDQLENAKAAEQRLAPDLKRLSDHGRAELLQAYEAVASKWNEIIAMLQPPPKKEVASPARKKAA